MCSCRRVVDGEPGSLMRGSLLRAHFAGASKNEFVKKLDRLARMEPGEVVNRMRFFQNWNPERNKISLPALFLRVQNDES